MFVPLLLQTEIHLEVPYRWEQTWGLGEGKGKVGGGSLQSSPVPYYSPIRPNGRDFESSAA